MKAWALVLVLLAACGARDDLLVPLSDAGAELDTGTGDAGMVLDAGFCLPNGQPQPHRAEVCVHR